MAPRQGQEDGWEGGHVGQGQDQGGDKELVVCDGGGRVVAGPAAMPCKAQ